MGNYSIADVFRAPFPLIPVCGVREIRRHAVRNVFNVEEIFQKRCTVCIVDL